jgi:hypothetical protein
MRAVYGCAVGCGNRDGWYHAVEDCARLGPESQNREGNPDFRAQLEGRVSFVEMINPNKGRRLRALLDRIERP